MKKLINSIQESIQALQKGEFIILCDDEDRENEGDLVIAGDKVTPEKLNFMIKHTGGVLTVPMKEEFLKKLDLPLMCKENTGPQGTAFTISVDYLEGTTTGISCHDRYLTIKALANPKSLAADFGRPGHIFPLKYTPGGVLKRTGHTEASIDLLEMADLFPVAVISELVNENGEMTRGEDLKNFADKYNLPILRISDLVRHRLQQETLVEEVSRSQLPTKYGTFTVVIFKSRLDKIEHIALFKGPLEENQSTLVRVHSECLTGDILGSLRCDCGFQLSKALEKIDEEGQGVLIYLRGHEGRGIGLGKKICAYKLQESGLDTVEANKHLGLPIDSREYGIGAQMLRLLGVTKMKLMTNNPSKFGGLEGFGLTITERVPLITNVCQENMDYLKTKKNKLGHLIEEKHFDLIKTGDHK